MFTTDTQSSPETSVAVVEPAMREIDISDMEAFSEAFLSGAKDVIFVI
jgi:hypothetical protein